MPPRKRPRCSSPDLEATARRSSRPNRGVGGHAAQLQKVGETIAASGRKGPKGDDLQISSFEENPMAPSQLQKGKKKPPAKPCSAPKKTQNEYRSTESSQHSQNPTSRPNLHVARSFERFGFKESQSNGRERASKRQPVQKEPQSSGHKTVGRNASQQDAGHEKELTDSNCKKDRQNADERRELTPSIHERDEFDDNADFDDNFDHDMQMDRDDARGDIDLGDELTDTEQDKAYDVLKRHRTKNGQCKAPSPTYLFKGSGKECARTFPHSNSPHQCPSQHIRSRSRQCSPPHVWRSKSYGLSAVQAHRRSPALHLRRSSHSKSPRQQSSQRHKYARTSSSRTQSPLWHLSQQTTSSSRSHTQPTSHGRPPSCSPSDTIIPSSREHSCSLTPEDTHRSGNSKCKVKTTQENPSKLGFYPPTWQAFLQIAKLEMQLQAVLAHPIPECQDALNLVREVLDTMLWTYHEKMIKLEKGYFPQYSTQMGRLLCNDLFTFCTELKKIVISIAKRAYDIFPQGSTMRKDNVQKQITTAATKLIKSGDYLRLPDLSGGKYKNFTAQALKDACLKFYYSNSKKALKNTNEFHRTIPINAMLLVAAVLKGVISGFRETGTDKVPDLTTEQCRIHFNNLRRSVDTLFNIPERREELEDMLEQWARVGMGDSEYATGSASGSDAEDVNIIL
ncbi:hypothetical protein EDD22DRAFT_951737 [Suillus occidentalis]|nr:hypothetical protein EDD22DRAFT_951737 [Suillus occidentalis]